MMPDLYEDITDEEIRELLRYYSKLLRDPETPREVFTEASEKIKSWPAKYPTAWERAFQLVRDNNIF